MRAVKPGTRLAALGASMTFWQAVTSCYSNYATFSGRASRSEYWFFTLYHTLLVTLCFVLIPTGVGITLLWLSAIGNFLPALSVLVRRLHDTDRSGWWYWIALVPFVGAILLLVWFCTRGTEGGNRFGGDPLEIVNLRAASAQRA
jgi:uncharacterized membrane protein YhaH (DUF805 family)